MLSHKKISQLIRLIKSINFHELEKELVYFNKHINTFDNKLKAYSEVLPSNIVELRDLQRVLINFKGNLKLMDRLYSCNVKQLSYNDMAVLLSNIAKYHSLQIYVHEITILYPKLIEIYKKFRHGSNEDWREYIGKYSTDKIIGYIIDQKSKGYNILYMDDIDDDIMEIANISMFYWDLEDFVPYKHSFGEMFNQYRMNYYGNLNFKSHKTDVTLSNLKLIFQVLFLLQGIMEVD